MIAHGMYDIWEQNDTDNAWTKWQIFWYRMPSKNVKKLKNIQMFMKENNSEKTNCDNLVRKSYKRRNRKGDLDAIYCNLKELTIVWKQVGYKHVYKDAYKHAFGPEHVDKYGYTHVYTCV